MANIGLPTPNPVLDTKVMHQYDAPERDARANPEALTEVTPTPETAKNYQAIYKGMVEVEED